MNKEQIGRLNPWWFNRPATILAPLLLGKLLCRRLPDGTVLRRRITETAPGGIW